MVPEIRTATDIIFCDLGPFFAFLPPNNPKNQNFEEFFQNFKIKSFFPKLAISTPYNYAQKSKIVTNVVPFISDI